MLTGSSSQVPLRPAGAVTSGRVASSSAAPEEVSTRPPSPPSGPPRAASWPCTVVAVALLTTTLPPLPRRVASARRAAPAATVTPRVLALPTATRPPPAPPEASSVAPVGTTTLPVAETLMLPPCPARLRAVMAPPAVAPPPSARSTAWPPPTAMRPVLLTRVLLTRVSTTPLMALALSCTLPPRALMVPLLVTRAAPSGLLRTCWVTSRLSRPSPARSSVKASAPCSATRPSRALMVPLLAARGPASTASPWSATVMVPRFSTRAPGLAAPVKAMRPAMKSWLVMPAALAIRFATLTWAPSAKTTPDWLTMAMPPLAVIRPAMTEGSGVVTRLRVQLCAFGWLNCTVWLAPTLKLFQSTAARPVDWLMVVVVAVCAILAAPATTRPPVGAAFGATPCAAATIGSRAVPASRAWRRRRARMVSTSPACGRWPRFRAAHRRRHRRAGGSRAGPPRRRTARCR